MRRHLQVRQQNQNNSSLEIRVSPQIVLRDDQEDYRKLKWELGWMRQWLKDTKSDENILMKRLFEMQCLANKWKSCTCPLAASCFSLKLSHVCVSSGFRASFVSERQQSATFISTRVEVCIAVTSESISSLQSCAEL
uniref:Uncharacterized protein n=1 Tax=Nothobranchius kadleci TaxID=1051664 RepID=A0A1A8E239_NOTKA